MAKESGRSLVGAIEAVLAAEERLGERSAGIDCGRRRIRLLDDAREVLNGWRHGAMTSESAQRALERLAHTTLLESVGTSIA